MRKASFLKLYGVDICWNSTWQGKYQLGLGLCKNSTVRRSGSWGKRNFLAVPQG